MKKLDRPIQDMPQIDSLRTIAVFAAIFSHYVPQTCRYFNYGHAGVQLFFTISGFLITGILLQCRSGIDMKGNGTYFYLKQFYARRFLRIFPLYYCVLAVLFLTNKLAGSLPYHLSYTSNMYMAVTGNVIPAGHFWSLCVEEQFYLFWPLVICICKRATLQRLMIGLIAFSILFRVYCLVNGYPVQTIFLLPANLDCLATGGLLSIALNSGYDKHSVARSTRIAAVTGLASLVLVVTLSVLYPNLNDIGSMLRFLFQDTVIALISAGVVWGAIHGFPGIPGHLLNLAPVRYLGRISYGLYVIHPFSPMATNRFMVETGYTISTTWAIILNLLITVAVASASWHLLEAPINSLKKFFPYKPITSTKLSIESDVAAATLSPP